MNRRDAFLASFAVALIGAARVATAQSARTVHHIATLAFGTGGANLGGARRITIPKSLLLRADEVIE